MIKVTDNSGENTLYFPKNSSVFPQSLIIRSEITHKEYSYDVEDTGSLNDYYIIKVDLSDIPDGEYNYYIKDEDSVLSSGLIVIGDYIPSKKEYNNDSTLIEYNG